ncbi:MAG: peptidoglycan DD-metalloendopeptidase family protein [Bacteroidales bacterium]|jgi:murein DD-endopeptidase MepM/ murein hydrolase activator NlpD|nr:peptidoglycan DD-metalloendopeptidase family protein [Bacteroidales bacterium]MDD4703812.1 peptidoglycan DD-metalloendopeptidase family protein [Bacteroidales bacterium]MDX9798610.1 peptidoglycan DD-metalloendopeptidase family protein [Bacteroidales bacterium]
MTYKSKFVLSIITLFMLPFFVMAQLPSKDGIHERGMMKNRTNVDKESSEYQIGIIKDTTRFRKSLMKFVGTSLVYDDAAETEEDILKETQPSPTSIHRKKTDFSNLIDPINLSLVDNKAKKFYSFPCEGVRVSSRFGPRRNRYHYGIDLSLRTGEPIKSMFDGKVRVAKRAGAYGNLVVIEHDNQLETYYAHLSRINVAPGDEIKAGEVLGLGGNTGRSTGPHLHLEIRYQGAAINPEDVIDFNNYALLNNELSLTKDNFRHHSSKRNTNLAKNNSSSKSKYTKVRRGETLSSIAKRHGTTVSKLAKLNNIKGSKIKAGQRLRVR